MEGSSQDGPWGSGGTWRGCRRSRRRGCEPAPTGPGHRDPVSWLVPEHPGPSQSASLRPMKGCSTHCLHLHPAAAWPSCCWRGCLDSVEQVLTHTSIELSAGALVLQAHPWAGTRMVPSLCLCLSLALSLSHLNFLPLSLSLPLCLCLYMCLSLSLCLYVSLSVSLAHFPTPSSVHTHLLCRSWTILLHSPDACTCWHSSPTRRRSTGRLGGWWSRPSAWEGVRSSGTSPP